MKGAFDDFFHYYRNRIERYNNSFDEKKFKLNLKRHFKAICKWTDIDKSDDYHQRVSGYWRMQVGKIISIKENFPETMAKIRPEFEELKQLGRIIEGYIEGYKIQDVKDFKKLKKSEIKKYRTVSNELYFRNNKNMGLFLNQISELFFFVEFQAKGLCSQLCLKFAYKIKNDEIVQHKEIFETLKKLSGTKENSQCEMCPVIKTCRFNIDFDSYAKLYVMYIKLRMISDYTELFYFGDIKIIEDVFQNFYTRTLSLFKKFDMIENEIGNFWSPLTVEDFGLEGY